MLNVELRPLLRRLSPYCRRALNEAAEGCIERGNHEISLEHLMLALLGEPNHDVHCILRHYNIEGDRVVGALQRQIERTGGGHAERPIYSRLLVDLVQQAWLLASIEYGHTEVRSGALLLAMAVDSQLIAQLNCDELDAIAAPALRKNFMEVLDYSAEPVSQTETQGGPSPEFSREGTPLDLYTQDFTAQARAGEIDPIFCRDNEIRQLIDILGRRRKNNPLAVGEAGVGKTALIEGLARRIAEGDVPDSLLNVDLLALDLQAMQAGASVKGEFEKRLKGVVEGVKASPKPIVLFIDEVHTLIGAGGSAGTGDAANILKPALARGELRTIAATTWSEYKKYIEKDAALARRFQLVKLEEPSPAQAVVIMRGLRKIYENAHNVYIRDDAVVAAAEMSARYISGRQLPDKAVDVLDTASARVKLSISAKPAALDDLEKAVQVLQREHAAIARDVESGVSQDTERLTELDEEMAAKTEQIEKLRERWHTEKTLAEQILALRGKLSDKPSVAENDSDCESDGDTNVEDDSESDIAIMSDDEIRIRLEEKTQELATLQDGDPLVSHEAGPDVVAKVIADWTGIPVGKMVRDQAKMILEFQQQLGQRVKGQDHAVEAIDMGVRASKAGVANPDAPIGVFLLVGPSGVGKTETALGVADLMFGGERFVTTVNMSEFMEKHTVSRLIGSPPGYVDSDKGGMLTEAVKQRPYSVVLLDEVEKAHPDVLNLFYQLFDKGELSDGQNLTVNFRNTIVFLTSNLGSDQIMSMWRDNADVSTEDISERIRPTLAKHFKQALLARMNVVPYFPLGDSVLRDIVDIKLGKLVRRLQESQRIALVYSDDVADQIVARCQEVETGARNIDYVINSTLIPSISTEVLSRMNDENMPDTLHIGLSDDGNFTYTFSHGQSES
ncbi:MAG: type VI secretion system ATPase TssH [Gammaproteobacteria bacterium]